MVHDITSNFRDAVYQKRNGLHDSQRNKLGRPPHPSPGDTQVDGAPPFMQAYMKEAYMILQQIASLTRMLAAVRRAYLDVHARPPPLTRQAVRVLDSTGVDALADIKYFTNAERDQIDVQARQILARCADRVRDMETLEKPHRPILQSPLPPSPALLVSDDAATASDFVSAHCAGVTWYLTRHLTHERVRRETERTRTLGSGVAHELAMSATASELARPGSSSWFGSASSALGASWAVPQRPLLEEMDPASSDDDEDDVELSASQIQQFEAENAQILRSAEDSLAAVQQAEARLLEISALQAELVAQLTRQTEVSDQLYEDAISTSEMVEKGNVQLREARRRARDGRKWLLLFLIGASLSLLFLHYY
ncbi:hypothetical protein BC826DRAFT_1022804 [Russula brevipes]|nr:hypothetical protein BC826DRAFT_1022804 [Russula brevipes]